MKLKIITIILLLAISNLFGKSVDYISMFTEQYPPYNMMIDGKLAGTSIEVLDAMLKQMKSKQSIKNVRMGSWARGYTIAQKKKNVMVFSTGRIKEREKLFKWVGPIGEIKIGIIAEKKQNIKINKISDLNQYRIGGVRKEAENILMLSHGVKKDVIEYVKGEDALDSYYEDITKNNIDVFSYNIDVAFAHGKFNGVDMSEYEVVYEFKKIDLYFAFNKNTDDAIISKWQKTLDEIKSNGSYAKIMKK